MIINNVILLLHQSIALDEACEAHRLLTTLVRQIPVQKQVSKMPLDQSKEIERNLVLS